MKLFVGNLSFTTTESTLEDLFTEHGSVQEVQLVTDRMTGRSRGFAFVTMGANADAEAAISALNGREFDGRTLSVSEARPKGDSGGDRGSSRKPSFGGKHRRS
jgi:cold-inducible RNA-binding protein